MAKRFLTVILALILMLTLALPALAEHPDVDGPVMLLSPKDVLNFGLRDDMGPLSITRGLLHDGDSIRDVYLICLSGAGYDLTNHNNFFEFLASAASIPTGYLKVVKNAAKSAIPAGSAVVLCGHSHGGTTAQQFAADSEMRARYEILNVCACGSPYIVLAHREGSLYRLSDYLDIVPQISIAGPVNLFKNISYEDGGYFGKLVIPHAESYYNSSVWNSYDCFGEKNGSRYLVCSYDDIMNFSLKIKLF